MKKCNECNIEKELSEFPKDINYKDGYRNKCKKCTSIVKKINYENNKEEILKKNKEYRDLNKLKISKKQKEYKENNAPKIKELSRKYRENNPDKIKNYDKDVRNQYRRNKRKNDPLYRITCNIRNSINYSINNKGYKKSSRTHEILGCSFDELLEHLNSNEYNFIYEDGLFDIDHIIPLSSATTEQELLELNHYTNFQLLPSDYNRYIKRDNDWDELNFKEWLLKYNI